MASSRDITLDLVGRDSTGHATRSAANNLDRLRAKMGKFNVDTDSSLKRRFSASGLMAASAFAQSFIRVVSGGLLGKGTVGMAAKMSPAAAGLGVALGVVVGAYLVKVAYQAILAGLPLALAAGIAAIPFAHLLKTQTAAVSELKGHWHSFVAFISKPMRLPFLAVLGEAAAGIDRLRKPFRDLVKALGPALAPFTRGVFDGIIGFVNALKPAMPAIVSGMQEWGRQLPGIGKALGEAFSSILADPVRVRQAVEDISGILRGLITVGSFVVRMAGYVELACQAVATSFYTMAIGGLTALANLLDGWAKINPRMKGPAAAVHGLLTGVQNDFTKTKNRWTETQQSIAKRVIVAKLKADKTDLEAKVAAAKRKLKDPDLTKERKAKIKAEIKAAQAALETIKAQLRGLDGTTANTYVNVHKNVSSKDAARGPARPSGKSSAAGDWQGAAGGWTSRTEPPRVVLGNTYNDTRVFLDSREIRSVARTTVMDETRRSASRARVGRR